MIMRLGSGGATLTSIRKCLWMSAAAVRTAMSVIVTDAMAQRCILPLSVALMFIWTPSKAA